MSEIGYNSFIFANFPLINITGLFDKYERIHDWCTVIANPHVSSVKPKQFVLQKRRILTYLENQSKFIEPSNWNIFFIPRTKSPFSCISDTNVKISNPWPCISIPIGMINNTLTNCPFPTWILWVLDVNFSNECKDLHHW